MKRMREVTFTRRFPKVFLWLVVNGAAGLFGLFSVVGTGWSSEKIAMMTIGEISSITFLGLLFFLGAVAFFTFQNIESETERNGRQIAKAFVAFLLLATVFLMVLSTIAFNMFSQFGEPGAEIGSAYICGALIASLVIAFIYCSLSAGLVFIVDDWRLPILIGCSLFLVTNLFLGMPNVASLYPEISLFSPSHFYRAMILLFAGFITSIPVSIQIWGGITSTVNLTLPILVYTILTICSLWAIKTYSGEYLRRRQLHSLSDSIEVTNLEQKEETQLREQLRTRRKAVLICFLIFGLLIPIGGYSYTSMRSYDVTTVVYEAILRPTNGTLFYGEFTTEVPTPDVSRWIGFPLTILDWGDCPSPIQFEYAFGDGSIYDFLALDEQDRWRPSQSENLENDQMVYLQSRSSGLDELAGVHYWAIRFYSDEWASELGSLRVRISIVLRDMRLL
jgi:hypothetical protein